LSSSFVFVSSPNWYFYPADLVPFPVYQEHPSADRVLYHADTESQTHHMLPLYHAVRPVPISSSSLPVAYWLLFVF
jgi:hypothetical protein